MLWATRASSGFPWPNWRGFSGGWRMALLGHPRWAGIPLWRQVLAVPLRPWRYARMVRSIARVRAMHYTAEMYDDVT